MRAEGAISVKAVIKGKKREVKEVCIRKDKKTKDFNYIRKIARMNDIPVKELGQEELEVLASGKSHGGVLAEVSFRKEDLLEEGEEPVPGERPRHVFAGARSRRRDADAARRQIFQEFPRAFFGPNFVKIVNPRHLPKTRYDF